VEVKRKVHKKCGSASAGGPESLVMTPDDTLSKASFWWTRRCLLSGFVRRHLPGKRIVLSL